LSPARYPGERGFHGGFVKSLARRRLLAGPPAPARPTPPQNRPDEVSPSECDGGPLAWPWAVVFRPTLVGCRCGGCVAGLAMPAWRCWAHQAFPLSRSFAARRLVALLSVAGCCWLLLLTADRRSRAFTGVAVVLWARLWHELGRLRVRIGVVGRFSVVLLDVAARFWAAGRRRRPAGSALRRGWPSLGAPERCWVLFRRVGWFSGRLGGLCAG